MSVKGLYNLGTNKDGEVIISDCDYDAIKSTATRQKIYIDKSIDHNYELKGDIPNYTPFTQDNPKIEHPYFNICELEDYIKVREAKENYGKLLTSDIGQSVVGLKEGVNIIYRSRNARDKKSDIQNKITKILKKANRIK